MGYYVKRIDRKNMERSWKLQFVSWKKEHCLSSKAKKLKKEWDIKSLELKELGFNECMTIEQARLRPSALNKSLEKIRLEESRLVARRKAEAFDAEVELAMPGNLRKEFESWYLFGRQRQEGMNNKSRSHWKASQKMILDVGLTTDHWFENKHEIYDWLAKRQYSLSYCKKIIRIVNLWGSFLSIKRRIGFIPVPYPRGYERTRICEQFHRKASKLPGPSKPIIPEQLDSLRNKLTLENFNWLYLSVWLGLRPAEIDRLQESENFKLVDSQTNGLELWVYQHKLVSKRPENRWKIIPLFLDEQKKVARIISQAKLRRPSRKTMLSTFDKNTTLYGGRKGFTDLMLSKRQRLEDICQWMGHSSIERTWRNYKDHLVAHYN